MAGAFPDLFTADYEYFVDAQIPTERTQHETRLIMDLAGLTPGQRVLDIGCGTGRIANSLAAAGIRVHGIDTNERFIERARREGANLPATYDVQDMQSLTAQEPFDAALLWFNTYGYFDDADNIRQLATTGGCLAPAGTLIIELHHRDWVIKNWHPAIMTRRGQDFAVDENELDIESGRTTSRRTYVRGGQVTGSARMHSRLLSPSEMRFWLESTGYNGIRFVGEDGLPLTMAHRRMITVARVAR